MSKAMWNEFKENTKEVYFESVQSVGEFNTQIDLSNYSKGIYNLTIKNTNGISNHKLILQ